VPGSTTGLQPRYVSHVDPWPGTRPTRHKRTSLGSACQRCLRGDVTHAQRQEAHRSWPSGSDRCAQLRDGRAYDVKKEVFADVGRVFPSPVSFRTTSTPAMTSTPKGLFADECVGWIADRGVKVPAEEARKAARRGLPVFATALNSQSLGGATSGDLQVRLEWSKRIAAIEAEGWRLEHWSVCQDEKGRAVGYPVFRRTSSDT